MHMVPDWVHFLQDAAGDRIRTKMMNTIASEQYGLNELMTTTCHEKKKMAM